MFNFDETHVRHSSSGGREKVAVEAVTRRAFAIARNAKMHITLGVLVSAEGIAHDTLVIAPRKTIPAEALELIDTLAMCFAFSEAGWMTKSVFENWVERVFLPAVRQARVDPKKPALLILDGHSSRLSYQAAKRLKDEYIDVGILPAHSSHITQPLDVCVFGALKTSLQSLRLDEELVSILKNVHDAISATVNFANISAGFERSGIWPTDVQRPLDSPGFQENQESTGEFTQKVSQRVNISGKFITRQDRLDKIKEREEQTKSSRTRRLGQKEDGGAENRLNQGERGEEGVEGAEDEGVEREVVNGRMRRIVSIPHRRKLTTKPRLKHLCGIYGAEGHNSRTCTGQRKT